MPPKSKEKPQSEAAPKTRNNNAPESPTLLQGRRRVRLEDKSTSPDVEVEGQEEQISEARVERAGKRTRAQSSNYNDINSEADGVIASDEEEEVAGTRADNSGEKKKRAQLLTGTFSKIIQERGQR